MMIRLLIKYKQFCTLVPFLILFTSLEPNIYPRLLATFPEMANPTELKVDDSYIYICEGRSAMIYNKVTYGLIKKLGNHGEGPQEFTGRTRIGLTDKKIVLYDHSKIVEYSKEFNFIKELSLGFLTYRLIPIDNKFLIEHSKIIKEKECICYSLYNSDMKLEKDIFIEFDYYSSHNYMINPSSIARYWNDMIFLSQPQTQFGIEIFNKTGEQLYQVQTKLSKTKYEEKHKLYLIEKIRYFLGSKKARRTRDRAKTIPTPEFVPDINNFWVTDNHIYVKTYDITDTTVKWIIMDLTGNIQQALNLPISYMEIQTIHNNTYYYLQELESETDTSWALYEINL